MNSVAKPQIKVLFLDLGGVIFELDWRAALSKFDITNSDAQVRWMQAFATASVQHRFECGKSSREEFLHDLKKFFKHSGSIETAEQAWIALVKGVLPGAEEIFARFSAKLPIIALSNTDTIHYENLLKNSPIMKNFTEVYTSFNLGFRKPNKEIYLQAARQAGVQPENCLFIDDTLDNVLSAAECGFTAHQSVNSPALTLEILHRYL